MNKDPDTGEEEERYREEKREFICTMLRNQKSRSFAKLCNSIFFIIATGAILYLLPPATATWIFTICFIAFGVSCLFLLFRVIWFIQDYEAYKYRPRTKKL